jgi:hypothetical protein
VAQVSQGYEVVGELGAGLVLPLFEFFEDLESEGVGLTRTRQTGIDNLALISQLYRGFSRSIHVRGKGCAHDTKTCS